MVYKIPGAFSRINKKNQTVDESSVCLCVQWWKSWLLAGGPSVSEQHGWESTVSQLIGGPNAAQQTMQLGFVLFCFSSHKRFCFTCVTSTIAARDPLRCDIFFFGRRLDACVSRGPCDVPGRADAEQRLSVGACLYKPCQRARPRAT